MKQVQFNVFHFIFDFNSKVASFTKNLSILVNSAFEFKRFQFSLSIASNKFILVLYLCCDCLLLVIICSGTNLART